MQQFKKMAEYIQLRYRNAFNFGAGTRSELDEFLRAASTNTQRTVTSTLLQLTSLFPNVDKSDLKQAITQFEEKDDHLLHLTSKNCKLMKKLRNHAKNSEY